MLFPPGIPISKRIFDLVATTLGLLLISPILLILAALVALFLGTPVIFCQERPGYKGRPFFIHKFRTMTDARDADGNLLPDAFRLTSLGRVLRALSLDELPELFDVLRGEMSLVGPRPLLMRYLDRVTNRLARELCQTISTGRIASRNSKLRRASTGRICPQPGAVSPICC